jgi:hypothetical protein
VVRIFPVILIHQAGKQGPFWGEIIVVTKLSRVSDVSQFLVIDDQEHIYPVEGIDQAA